jgi:hypothetical protein
MVTTMRVVSVTLLVACGGAAAPPATRPLPDEQAGAHVDAPTSARPALTRLLAGPYPDLDAHAATLPARRLGQPDGLDPAPPLTELAVLVSEIGGEEGHCALAVRTGAGWFVGPWGPPCREPSYIEVEDASVATPEDDVVAVSLGVFWHTKDYDDEARYRLTALCGAPAGRPRCTPLLVTSCEAHAPVGGCFDHGWDLRVDVDGTIVTFAAAGDAAPAPPPDVAAALVGAHPLW